MVLVQNWPFFHFFGGGNIEKENVFYYFLERKNYFLCYKNKKLEKSKNWYFLHSFGPKLTLFPSFFF